MMNIGSGGEDDNILLLQDGWIPKHVQAGAVRLLVAPTGRKLLIVITVTLILYEYIYESHKKGSYFQL